MQLTSSQQAWSRQEVALFWPLDAVAPTLTALLFIYCASIFFVTSRHAQTYMYTTAHIQLASSQSRDNSSYRRLRTSLPAACHQSSLIDVHTIELLHVSKWLATDWLPLPASLSALLPSAPWTVRTWHCSYAMATATGEHPPGSFCWRSYCLHVSDINVVWNGSETKTVSGHYVVQ